MNFKYIEILLVNLIICDTGCSLNIVFFLKMLHVECAICPTPSIDKNKPIAYVVCYTVRAPVLIIMFYTKIGWSMMHETILFSAVYVHFTKSAKKNQIMGAWVGDNPKSCFVDLKWIKISDLKFKNIGELCSI